jgi:hypothetical protein
MNVLAILLSALILSPAAEAKTVSANKNSASSNPKFLALCDQFVKDSLALSPVSASQAGYHKHRDPETGKILELDAELDDVSAAAFEHQRTFYQQWRTRFQKETPLASWIKRSRNSPTPIRSSSRLPWMRTKVMSVRWIR